MVIVEIAKPRNMVYQHPSRMASPHDSHIEEIDFLLDGIPTLHREVKFLYVSLTQNKRRPSILYNIRVLQIDRRMFYSFDMLQHALFFAISMQTSNVINCFLVLNCFPL